MSIVAIVVQTSAAKYDQTDAGRHNETLHGGIAAKIRKNAAVGAIVTKHHFACDDAQCGRHDMRE